MDIVNRHTTAARWTGSSSPTSRSRRSLATMTLGDLGAEVVKLERPEVGHETSSRQPPNSHDGQSTYYLAVNRNRRSLTLDLSTSDGCAAAKRLATSVDVSVGMDHRGTCCPLCPKPH
jgi:crotonobetainyl-CoA:carnitine CoA-transferase CaiB-like acyl-CoA transferase